MLATDFHAGQRWTYRVSTGFESSRLIVGAVLTFADREPVVCCAVKDAPSRLPNGSVGVVTIPFLPLSASAMVRTVLALDGMEAVPEGFAEAFAQWQADSRGLSAFTVPFDGRLDRLIALQMAEIAGVDPAE